MSKRQLTKPAAMNGYDWLVLELGGKEYKRTIKGYYYGGRLSEKQLPEGYHRYDLRECDDEPGDIASIKDFVLVNHHGTFITRETIDCSEEIPVTWWSWDPYDEPFTDGQLETLSDILHEYKDYNRSSRKLVLAAMEIEKRLTEITLGAYRPDTTYNVN